MEEIIVHGLDWTTKELFVYPNEFIYWSIQIVMYPYMTGLVAGAFVLSSLYHVFDQKELRDIARFSLVFSLALLPVAALPLLFHLQQPSRALNPLLTPHFTSAIAAFGIVFSTYGVIVASEIWFVYRAYIVKQIDALKAVRGSKVKRAVYRALSLGADDMSDEALATDRKAVKILAGIGIPVACFLHGYAGFIFGSVKANALWMSPLMPVIFIMSAVVSGMALCILTYTVIMEWQKFKRRFAVESTNPGRNSSTAEDTVIIDKAVRYLLGFLVAAISLELLDLIFRGYTAMKSWDILRHVMYGKDFINIFILQYGIGNLLPFILLIIPGKSLTKTVVALILILFGVFMMRWNVVIGGQAFSLSFSGYMHYHLPILPHNIETFKEGVLGALLVFSAPFPLFWVLNRYLPCLKTE